MRLFLFLFLIFPVLTLVSCETTQMVHHKAQPLPPEIQEAQNEVWDLQYQLYQAQHDLAIARIDQNEADISLQKSGNPAAYANQYGDLMSKLELERSKAEQRYTLAQQWYSDIQSGDIDAAHTVQQEMNQF